MSTHRAETLLANNQALVGVCAESESDVVPRPARGHRDSDLPAQLGSWTKRLPTFASYPSWRYLRALDMRTLLAL